MKTDAPGGAVLLSGGLDSATTLAIAMQECSQCQTLTFDYGQRNRVELRSAARVAKSLGACEHHLLRIPLGQWGGSSLTDETMRVPRAQNGGDGNRGIPNTYVPARNTVFLAHALAFAESVGLERIYIGVSSVDYSGYPDCRPEYIDAFRRLSALATRRGVEGEPVEVRAPLLHLSKAEAIKKGMELGVDYSLTQSCYDPGLTGRACGQCESCRLRLQAFRQAGLSDPLEYMAH